MPGAKALMIFRLPHRFFKSKPHSLELARGGSSKCRPSDGPNSVSLGVYGRLSYVVNIRRGRRLITGVDLYIDMYYSSP
jgi:hypothetical protein